MADSLITPRCDYTLQYRRDSSLILGANWGLSHTAYLQLICVVPSDVISHLGIVFLCPLYKEKRGWHSQRAKSKNRTKCLQEWVSYQDREWCCTPGIPVPAPDRSDPRTWALGWCRFSCGCGSPGCSPCCTATRRSRTTNLRLRRSRRSYRGGERLLSGKSVDRVTVLSILSG